MALRAVTSNGVAITPSSVSLPTGGTFDLYNTADQTTNYERLRANWLSNVAQIFVSADGTGAQRALQVGITYTDGAGAPQTYTQWNPSSPWINHVFATDAAAGTGLGQHRLYSGAISAASGTQVPVSITPTINQSGTAGATILNVDPIVTATGSGSYLAQRWGWNGSTIATLDSTGVLNVVSMRNSGSYGLGSSFGVTDVVVTRDAADTLALRRSTNAQTFRIYKTYTDASNYERLDLTWSGSQAFIGVAYAGTGAGRELQFVSYGSAAFTLTATAHMAISAGTTARSQINFASSTAPTSPADGDLWFDGTNLKLRVSGATYTITKT